MKNIWTNGCFDIIHVGHIRLFEYAKSLGEKLFVGIDGDKRVKELKGHSRPINNQINRKNVLESIKWIDSVYIFHTESDLEDLIQKLDISTIIVGDDYRNKKIIGSKYCSNIVFFPKIPDISSSHIINEMTFNAK